MIPASHAIAGLILLSLVLVSCACHILVGPAVCVCSAFGTVGSLLAFKFAGADENGANKGTDQLYTCDTVGDVQLSPCS